MAGEDRAAALVQQVADAGRTGIAVRADVRTEEGVVAAVEAAERELGGLAAVVHSVGAWGCQWRRGAGRRVTGSVLDATGGLR